MPLELTATAVRRPSRHCRWLQQAVVAVGTVLWLAAICLAAAPHSLPPLAQRLQQPLTFSADAVPARQLAERLSQTRQVPIFWDRRLDPARPVSVILRNRPLREGLVELAEQIGAAPSELSAAVYLGPPETAAGLATQVELLTESLAGLPPATRARWLARRPLHWDDLAVPMDIVEGLARELGLPLRCDEHVMHDLWPAVHIDEGLTLVERVSLVLAGFGATLQIHSDGSATSIDFPSHPILERSYRLTPAQLRQVQAMRSTFPDSQLDVRGNVLRVIGRLEHHRAIDLARRPPQPAARSAPVAEKRYQLRIQQQTLAAVLDYLHTSLGLEFQIPGELQPQLQQRVSLDVNQLTVDEILEALLQPAGIRFERHGQVITLEAS